MLTFSPLGGLIVASIITSYLPDQSSMTFHIVYLTEVQLNQLNQGRSQGPLRATRQHVDLLITARHGLRVTEAVDLHWDQVDFAKGYLHIRRLKKRH